MRYCWQGTNKSKCRKKVSITLFNLPFLTLWIRRVITLFRIKFYFRVIFSLRKPCGDLPLCHRHFGRLCHRIASQDTFWATAENVVIWRSLRFVSFLIYSMCVRVHPHPQPTIHTQAGTHDSASTSDSAKQRSWGTR